MPINVHCADVLPLAAIRMHPCSPLSPSPLPSAASGVLGLPHCARERIFDLVAERSIRVAGEAGASVIARLHLASYRAAYRDLLPEGFLAELDIGAREQRWRDSLRDPTRTTFLVEDRQGHAATAVAFAEIGPCRDGDVSLGTGELIALHVAEKCWRQGIAPPDDPWCLRFELRYRLELNR